MHPFAIIILLAIYSSFYSTVNLKFMTSQERNQLKHRCTEYTLGALLLFLDS